MEVKARVLMSGFVYGRNAQANARSFSLLLLFQGYLDANAFFKPAFVYGKNLILV